MFCKDTIFWQRFHAVTTRILSFGKGFHAVTTFLYNCSGANVLYCGGMKVDKPRAVIEL